MAETERLMPSGGSQKKKTSFTGNLILGTIVACLGSIQYGYHIAELNAPQEYLSCSRFDAPDENISYEDTWVCQHGLKQCIALTDSQFGAVTSIFTIGGLFGSYYAGNWANRYGRKYVSMGASAMCMVSSLLLFFSNSYLQLLFGRFLVGMSCGTAIVITPLFINEITPVEWRGAMGSMNQVSINLGILLTQSLALKYADSYNWRWLLFAGSVVAVVNLLVWLKVDESPRWLLDHGFVAEAEVALFKLRPGTYQQAKQEIQDWQSSHAQNRDPESSTEAHSPPKLWQYVTDASYKKPRTVILTILTCQQFCGINSIIFYGVKVIGKILPDYSIQINFAISILNVVVTLIASAIIDHVGRRPLLLASTTIMVAMSLLISVGLTMSVSFLLVVATFVYIAAFAIGLGPIPFLIIGELSYPQDAATAQSFGTVCNWLATFIVGYLFPIGQGLMGGYVFTIFAAIAALFATYVYKRVPETKGKATYSDVWAGY
ncbi:hypothetical protein SKDZ_02G3470 [Saccharomyces kudriavzevii ZP591]|uniref:Major facilitator superfamily (MFS) profile domain-containing protein n=2 Tax=Saccharomyces TaxID=4930 RepID=A0AA35JE76_SACK1|nr:uncharacterized protein SKDI_02G3490 [Saccharomyces kudriavzevii IFO 1802]CAI4055926.1 hypothetical protein SKDZ_02G3470 [Saccharomyces kudriavzevii ZP591]CAI4055999.1 hypothetical protein SKDI_02G3490 [Saccharomyces kudriavzevii IFO 1802]